MNNNHALAWTAPQPFWANARGDVEAHEVLSQPQILRFANDEFMNELLATLETDPTRLTQYAVMEETWRGPGPAPEREPSRWLERPTTKVLGLQRKSLLKSRAAALAARLGPVRVPVPLPVPSRLPLALPVTLPVAKLKLYQPAQMRHYLVSGSLVCQVPGLPDREVNPARHRVSFVVRRLIPKTPGSAGQPLPNAAHTALWDEFAFVLGAKLGQWRKVAAAADENASATLVRGEERLSMFPAFYAQDDGHRRRLFVGSVPVGKREVYQGAAANSAPPPAQGGGETAQEKARRLGTLDPRVVLFQIQVVGPWKALVNVAMQSGPTGPGVDLDDRDTLKAARHERVFAESSKSPSPQPPGPFDITRADPDALRAERSAMQTSSWYLLLDLYLFLSGQLPAFWAEAQKPSPNFASTAATALYQALRDAALPLALTHEGNSAVDLSVKLDGKASLVQTRGAYVAADVRVKLIDALRDIAVFQRPLEAAPDRLPPATGRLPPFEIPEPAASGAPASKPAGWPNFLFLFADAWFGVRQPPTPGNFAPPPGDYLSEKIAARIDSLADLLTDYLSAAGAGEVGTEPVPEPMLASLLPADMREAWYVMRLVYERPDCAPFHSTVVSAATRPFQMAGFFDSDAPGRPIRIGLPIDISPAGLRKFDKNAVFMMSDMLCGQVDRFKGLGLVDIVLSVLPWPFHKPLRVPEKGPCATGMMCSMSIPIITICALILLTIIVSLLHVIFFWVPLFTVCFPLPGFKGKKPLDPP